MRGLRKYVLLGAAPAVKGDAYQAAICLEHIMVYNSSTSNFKRRDYAIVKVFVDLPV